MTFNKQQQGTNQQNIDGNQLSKNNLSYSPNKKFWRTFFITNLLIIGLSAGILKLIEPSSGWGLEVMLLTYPIGVYLLINSIIYLIHSIKRIKKQLIPSKKMYLLSLIIVLVWYSFFIIYDVLFLIKLEFSSRLVNEIVISSIAIVIYLIIFYLRNKSNKIIPIMLVVCNLFIFFMISFNMSQGEPLDKFSRWARTVKRIELKNAVDSKDPLSCLEVAKYYKNTCYMQQAIKTNDVELCDNLPTPQENSDSRYSGFYECIFKIAEETGSQQACDKLLPYFDNDDIASCKLYAKTAVLEKEFFKETKFSGVAKEAIKLGIPNLCATIKDKDEKNNCYLTVAKGTEVKFSNAINKAIKSNDPDYCNIIEHIDEQNNCYLAIAKENDITWCKKIPFFNSANQRQACYEYFGLNGISTSSFRIEDINKIIDCYLDNNKECCLAVGDYKVSKCFEIVAEARNDTSYCDLMSCKDCVGNNKFCEKYIMANYDTPILDNHHKKRNQQL